ncbi:MAG: hypothetical protein IPM29_23755 [Planctomycetes bacterium]|nr:hypothetical protein [Planctomycetota bacterium]
MTLLPLSATAVLATAGLAFLIQDPGGLKNRPGGPAAATTAQQGDNLLRVTDSTNALELQIGKYFKDEKGWKVDYRTLGDDAGDLLLDVSFGVEKHAPISFTINAVPAARDGDKVVETRISIRSWFVIGVGPDHPMRGKVLEAINEHLQGYWIPQRVYLDSDGDLTLESNVNIPGADYPVHPEQIADLVIRTVYAWETLADKLEERGCPLPKK